MSKLVARIGLPALAVLALAGCGSSSKSTSTPSTSSTAETTAGVPSVVAEVPAAIKSKGTLNVATEARYPPNEFIAPDGCLPGEHYRPGGG